MYNNIPYYTILFLFCPLLFRHCHDIDKSIYLQCAQYKCACCHSSFDSKDLRSQLSAEHRILFPFVTTQRECYTLAFYKDLISSLTIGIKQSQWLKSKSEVRVARYTESMSAYYAECRSYGVFLHWLPNYLFCALTFSLSVFFSICQYKEMCCFLCHTFFGCAFLLYTCISSS
jgi:hypothetical protein